METPTQPTSVASKRSASTSTFFRVARYAVVRLLTLFVTVVIGNYFLDPAFHEPVVLFEPVQVLYHLG